ncbi:MAG: hypothetical protein ABS57_05235 [Mesorhizobium sp. SCN 65-12]|nr:MAG: hypothetical protein ABS57_05235 [Mesorhizobium sp. SCN 65-12]
MKHQTLDQLHAVAEIDITQPLMSRTQRLVRWAELLEREPSRLLTALTGTEYRAPEQRDLMRGDGSPISVAAADPILRDEGLADDSYGEAKRFFELTDNQLHEIVCYCHVGEVMQSSRAALSVRAALG